VDPSGPRHDPAALGVRGAARLHVAVRAEARARRDGPAGRHPGAGEVPHGAHQERPHGHHREGEHVRESALRRRPLPHQGGQRDGVHLDGAPGHAHHLPQNVRLLLMPPYRAPKQFQ